MGSGASSFCMKPDSKTEHLVASSSTENLLGSISKAEPLEEALLKLSHMVDYLSRPTLDWTTMNTHKALFFLRHYSGPLPTTTKDQRLLWVEALRENGVMALFVRWWSHLFSKKLFDRKNEGLMRNFRMLVGIGWNCTEVSRDCCREFTENNGFPTLISAMNSPPLSCRKLEDDKLNVSRLYVAHGCGSILRNVLQLYPEGKNLFRDAGGLEACKKSMATHLDIVKCIALLCVAYGINEDEQHFLSTTDELLKYLLKMLNDCIGQPNHVGKRSQFGALELIHGINHVASNDANKAKLVKFGILEPYSNVLHNPVDEAELLLVIRGIWTLAFHKENRSKIQNTEYFIIPKLQRLVYDEKAELAEAAKGALWVISGGKDEAETPSPGDHIMISYQWHFKPIILRLKEHLAAAGHRCWLDVEQMSGSTLEAMALAVEGASTVLICFSEPYKNSPSCRTEAEYTYKLRKEIIPLRLQSGYSPDGWLGILLGTKLYYDLSTPEFFQKNIVGLLRQLSNRTIKNNNDNCAIVLPAQTSPALSLKQQREKDAEHYAEAKFATWSKEEVSDWLQENDLEVLQNTLQSFDGPVLVGLRKMLQRAPKTYYSSLKSDVGIKDMVLLLKFTNLLESLDCHDVN